MRSAELRICFDELVEAFRRNALYRSVGLLPQLRTLRTSCTCSASSLSL